MLDIFAAPAAARYQRADSSGKHATEPKTEASVGAYLRFGGGYDLHVAVGTNGQDGEFAELDQRDSGRWHGHRVARVGRLLLIDVRQWCSIRGGLLADPVCRRRLLVIHTNCNHD